MAIAKPESNWSRNAGDDLLYSAGLVRVRPLAVAFGLTLTAIWTVPALPVSAGTGTITGQLVDGDSGNNAPAVGVTVQACSGGSCVGTPVVSDSNGNYALSSVPTGTWTVLTLPPTPCGPTDFARAQASNVSVSDTQTTTAPTIILTRAKGGIRGRTYDRALGPLHPIVGATVFADNAEQGGNGYQGATTDANGYFELNCLPAQRGYFITAGAPSYVDQADSLFTVTDGISLYHDMALSQGTSAMHGHVTCGGQVCSPGAGILVLQFCGAGGTGASNPCALSSLSTDLNGDFFTPANSLLAGNYTVHVFAPPGWDNGAYFNIPVLSGENHAMPPMNLIQSTPAASGRLIGNVTDAAGANYSNCRMNTFNQMTATPPIGQGFLTGVPTNADGFYDTGYTLTPDTNGQYRVWLDCPGHDEVTTNVDSLGERMTLGPNWTRRVNFFWPEPPRPYTGGSVAVGAPSAGSDAYFAEGFTGLGGGLAFHEYLTVQNPNTFSEVLTVDYLLASGQVVTKTYTLNAQSRTTINVNADVGPNQNVSAHLHTVAGATPPNTFVAERPMYFMFPGGIDGGDDVMGAQSLGTTYYFAEGYTGAGFHEYLTLANPNPTDAAVNVTYFFNGGAAPMTVAHTILAHSRSTVDVNQEAGANQALSIMVTSTNAVSFLAERPMYFNFRGRTGGSVVVGAVAPATALNLAEGHVDGNFDEFLTVLNPNTSAATVTVTYERTGASPLPQTVTVPANSRGTIHVNDFLAAGTDAAVHIQSTQPVVVERPMYFNFGGRTGGHDAVAVPDTALSTTLNFAEGFTGGSFDEYLTLMNPDPVNPATVQVTYIFDGASPKTVPHTIPPSSRFTIHVNDPAEAGPGKSVSVQISSSIPILGERPMYFAY